MTEYKPFAISNFRTGFDQAVEPWLLPRDGYQMFKNAHLYRGVLEKIPGYDLYASMSYRTEVAMTGLINGVNQTYTTTIPLPANLPTTTNFYAQAATNAGATVRETFTYLSDASSTVINLIGSAGGTGTVNLATGAVSITFNAAPPSIMPAAVEYNSVIFAYDHAPDANRPIMGIKPYYAQNGSRDILIFNTRRAGRIITLTGTIASTAAADNGITELPHEVQVQGVVTVPAFNGAATAFTGTIAGAPLVPGSVTFTVYSNTPALLGTITDNGSGLLQGSLLNAAQPNFINYATGQWVLNFTAAPAATSTINSSVCVYGNTFTGTLQNFFSVTNYQFKAFITNNVDNIRYYDGTCLRYLDTHLVANPGNLTYPISTCLHVHVTRERLLLIAPIVNNVLEGNTIYWSVAGNPLSFTNNEQLPAPTSEQIKAFGDINTDVVVRFSNSERVFRYTGDAFSPFRWDPTNVMWRCDASFSSINYDSWFSTVGKPAIVGSDAVNVKRVDEIIPDFTFNNRVLEEAPIISIDQTSIGQCYGERFDDFKEGWLCYKGYTANNDGTVKASDNVLAFNYLDNTYAVYTFPFSCLGFGTVTSIDTWGNNFDEWSDANYAWATFYESFNALVDLGGDQFGKVYTLGNGNQLTKAIDGSFEPVRMDVLSKNFNPFIEDGELCRLGFVDLFVSANAETKLRVQFFLSDQMYEDADGNPAGAYQETTLTFVTTDSMSSSAQTKVWKRIYVGAVGKEHTIRLYQHEDDFTADTLNQPVSIHALVPYFKPAGRIFN